MVDASASTREQLEKARALESRSAILRGDEAALGWLECGRLYRHADDERAVQALRRSLQFKPGYEPALETLADILSDQGTWPEVIDLLEALARNATTEDRRAGFVLKRGAALERLSRWAEARSMYRTVLRVATDPAVQNEARARLAQVEAVLSGRAPATPERPALRREPTPQPGARLGPKGRSEAVQILIAAKEAAQQGRHDEALRLAERGLELEPANDRAWQLRNAILEQAGQHELLFRKLLSEPRPTKPGAITALRAAAKIAFERLGDTERAVDCFKRALAIDESDEVSLTEAVKLAVSSGELDVVQRVLPGASKARRAEVLDSLAQAAQVMGDPAGERDLRAVAFEDAPEVEAFFEARLALWEERGDVRRLDATYLRRLAVIEGRAERQALMLRLAAAREGRGDLKGAAEALTRMLPLAAVERETQAILTAIDRLAQMVGEPELHLRAKRVAEELALRPPDRRSEAPPRAPAPPSAPASPAKAPVRPAPPAPPPPARRPPPRPPTESEAIDDADVEEERTLAIDEDEVLDARPEAFPRPPRPPAASGVFEPPPSGRTPEREPATSRAFTLADADEALFEVPSSPPPPPLTEDLALEPGPPPSWDPAPSESLAPPPAPALGAASVASPGWSEAPTQAVMLEDIGGDDEVAFDPSRIDVAHIADALPVHPSPAAPPASPPRIPAEATVQNPFPFAALVEETRRSSAPPRRHESQAVAVSLEGDWSKSFVTPGPLGGLADVEGQPRRPPAPAETMLEPSPWEAPTGEGGPELGAPTGDEAEWAEPEDMEELSEDDVVPVEAPAGVLFPATQDIDAVPPPPRPRAATELSPPRFDLDSTEERQRVLDDADEDDETILGERPAFAAQTGRAEGIATERLHAGRGGMAPPIDGSPAGRGFEAAAPPPFGSATRDAMSTEHDEPLPRAELPLAAAPSIPAPPSVPAPPPRLAPSDPPRPPPAVERPASDPPAPRPPPMDLERFFAEAAGRKLPDALALAAERYLEVPAEGWVWLGRGALEERREVEADLCFQRAIDSAAEALRPGVVWLIAEAEQRARRRREEALALAALAPPDSAEAALRVARAFRLAEVPVLAHAWAAAALAVDPRHGPTGVFLVELAGQDHAALVELLERLPAPMSSPSGPSSFSIALGKALRAAGDRRRAAEAFGRALAQEGGGDDALRALVELGLEGEEPAWVVTGVAELARRALLAGERESAFLMSGVVVGLGGGPPELAVVHRGLARERELPPDRAREAARLLGEAAAKELASTPSAEDLERFVVDPAAAMRDLGLGRGRPLVQCALVRRLRYAGPRGWLGLRGAI